MTINLLYRTLNTCDEEYLIKMEDIPEVLFLRLNGCSTLLAAIGPEITSLRKKEIECPGSGRWDYELLGLDEDQNSKLEEFVKDFPTKDVITVNNRNYPFVTVSDDYSVQLRDKFAEAIKQNRIALPIAQRYAGLNS